MLITELSVFLQSQCGSGEMVDTLLWGGSGRLACVSSSLTYRTIRKSLSIENQLWGSFLYQHSDERNLFLKRPRTWSLETVPDYVREGKLIPWLSIKWKFRAYVASTKFGDYGHRRLKRGRWWSDAYGEMKIISYITVPYTACSKAERTWCNQNDDILCTDCQNMLCSPYFCTWCFWSSLESWQTDVNALRRLLP